MDLGKVKNTLILLLIAANILLGGLFVGRLWIAQRQRDEMQTQIISLLQVQGVKVAKLPDERTRVQSYLVSRDQTAETKAVTSLLGTVTPQDLQGGIIAYENERGAAQFRRGGRFDIAISSPHLISSGALATFTIATLQNMGFVAETQQGNLTTPQEVTVAQTIFDYPVFNARAVFRYNDAYILTQVYGVWALGAVTPEQDQPCLSAGTVLLQYAKTLENAPLVINDVQLGYRLTPQTSTIARLRPEWRIICDNKELYLDAYTGVLVTGLE